MPGLKEVLLQRFALLPRRDFIIVPAAGRVEGLKAYDVCTTLVSVKRQVAHDVAHFSYS